ncbi:olfactory receptor 1361-like [Gracilinanus agilis]|uniref:olfactory receptor 1361-like n=1 Tax=Gracilinanus agilis TaxID=191870 RepID=UPI001CFC6716|nr:olfactory receptor 1361-like [Gracilinanus agilis]
MSLNHQQGPIKVDYVLQACRTIAAMLYLMAPADWIGLSVGLSQSISASPQSRYRISSNITARNQTSSSEFLLLAFSTHQELLFPLFLALYLAALLGNLMILIAVGSDPHLHTPMFVLLVNLSLADLCFTSTTVPRLLHALLTGDQTITHSACLSQVFFFLMAGNVDSYVLAAMAWDRYVAICRPLHYATVVTLPRCMVLLGAVWVGTALHSLLHTVLTAHLTFCSNRALPYFFCDLHPLIHLACSDTSLNYMMVIVEGGFVIIMPAICIMASYVFIVAAVCKIRAPGGFQKAFSTCGSHLTVVLLFYGTVLCVYLQPPSQAEGQERYQDLMATVMFSVVAPTLNPYIYSLQNREIKAALVKVLMGS